MLNGFVTNGTIQQAVAFSMQAEMLSGPLALKRTQKLHDFIHITQKVNRALIGVHRELIKVRFA